MRRNNAASVVLTLMGVGLLWSNGAAAEEETFGASVETEVEAEQETGAPVGGGVRMEDPEAGLGGGERDWEVPPDINQDRVPVSEMPPPPEPEPRSTSSTRIGLQARLDAMHLLDLVEASTQVATNLEVQDLQVPIATPGLRLANGRLFLGVGFGFTGSSEKTPNEKQARSAFSLSPLAMIDLLSDRTAALFLGGWANLVMVGETEWCQMNRGCTDMANDAFGWGLTLVTGARGKISEALAIGGEFGWGFLSISQDSTELDKFAHGLVGSILFEATVGI